DVERTSVKTSTERDKEWVSPPCQYPRENRGRDHQCTAQNRQLCREPLRSRYALRPRQAIGAVFKLARYKRRSPKQPDQKRKEDERRNEMLINLVVAMAIEEFRSGKTTVGTSDSRTRGEPC